MQWPPIQPSIRPTPRAPWTTPMLGGDGKHGHCGWWSCVEQRLISPTIQAAAKKDIQGCGFLGPGVVDEQQHKLGKYEYVAIMSVAQGPY